MRKKSEKKKINKVILTDLSMLELIEQNFANVFKMK